MENPIQYDFIIVGAGMAGLTSAAFLSGGGSRTLLCEQAEKVGGLAATFKDNGFTFDAGIRAFENSGILFPMLDQLGIRLDTVESPVSIGIQDEIIHLRGPESLKDYRDLLCRKFPQNTEDVDFIVSDIQKIMTYMDVLYGIDNPLFTDAMKDKKYIFMTLLPWLIKYKINIRKVNQLNEPVEQYLRRYTQNHSLIDIIAQHFFKKTPTFFALSYFRLYLEYRYPIGGTGVLPRKMFACITEKGGVISTKTRIAKIYADEKTIETSEGKLFKYKKLIWCADMKSLYAAIDTSHISDKKLQNTVLDKRSQLKKYHGGDSVLTIYLSVDLGVDYFTKTCGAHCFYTPVTTGQSKAMGKKGSLFADIGMNDAKRKKIVLDWLDEYLDVTTYEISCPVLRDPALAPEGKTGVIVSTLMDYDLARYSEDNGWYQEFKDFCESKIITMLNNSIFPGISGNILNVSCSSPITIERMTGNSEGAITGWAFTNSLIPAENNLENIANAVTTPIPDIYQAGQWTFSPSGMPVSILTGKLAADKAIKDLEGGL